VQPSQRHPSQPDTPALWQAPMACPELDLYDYEASQGPMPLALLPADMPATRWCILPETHKFASHIPPSNVANLTDKRQPTILLMTVLVCFGVHFLGSALTLLVGRQEGHTACKKTERWGAGAVICLERGADLHTAHLLPLLLTVSCFSKIQIGFAFLVPAHLG